jgi:hypothetical protein
LISQLRDLLLMNLDIPFELLTIALIRNERGPVGFKAPRMSVQLLFYFSDVFGESRNLVLEIHDPSIKRLETQRKSKVLEH